jgi:hypothetical protein
MTLQIDVHDALKSILSAAVCARTVDWSVGRAWWITRPVRSGGSGESGLFDCAARPTPGAVRRRCYTRSMTATGQTAARPGRNEPCRCGSGRKYKHCCLEKDDETAAKARAEAAAEPVALPSEDAGSKPAHVAKPPTDQPWKTRIPTRGFVPRSRTPRKVGGG